LAAAAALAALAAAWILYVDRYRHGGDRALAWADLSAKLGRPQFAKPVSKAFHDAASLERFVSRPPPIDFPRREAVLVASGPRSSTGYSLDVLRVTDERSRIVVEVRERTPHLGDPVRAAVTYPFRLITFPRSDKPVKIEWQGRP
jgi:hypothetical protein